MFFGAYYVSIRLRFASLMYSLFLKALINFTCTKIPVTDGYNALNNFSNSIQNLMYIFEKRIDFTFCSLIVTLILTFLLKGYTSEKIPNIVIKFCYLGIYR